MRALRFYTLFAFLSLLIFNPSLHAAPIVTGSYSELILETQNGYHENNVDCGCDRCMSQTYPSLPVWAFLTSGDHCNGIKPPLSTPWAYGDMKWKYFWLFGDMDQLQQHVIDGCNQNWYASYEDPPLETGLYCSFIDDEGYLWYVRGAYRLAGATTTDRLESLIERGVTGRGKKSTTADKASWSDMCALHNDVRGDFEYENLSSWGKRFVLAMALWSESCSAYPTKLVGQTNPALVKAKDLEEIDLIPTDGLQGLAADKTLPEGDLFWLKVMAHAWVCFTDYRWDGYTELSTTDLVPGGGWPFIIENTPSFVFEIADNTTCIDNAPVRATEGEISWGTLKSMYR